MTKTEELIAVTRSKLRSGDITYEDVRHMLKLSFTAGFTAGRLSADGDRGLNSENAWDSFQEFSDIMCRAVQEYEEQNPTEDPDL